MRYTRKFSIIAGFLSIFSCSSMATAHTLKGSPRYWYAGINTGASFIHNSSRDKFVRNNNEILFREDHSQRGFNGGIFLGWNFYTCDVFNLALELTADLYSNRGHYTIDAFDDASQRTIHHDVNYDMNYAFHLALRPGFCINDCTMLYFTIGAAYGDFEIEMNNRNSQTIGPGNPQSISEDEWLWGFSLGTGLKRQLSCNLSVFAAYEYTYYGKESFDDMNMLLGSSISDQARIGDREACIDSNTFKLGLIYNF